MINKKDICAFPDCGKELTHKEGRKKRKYCSPACGRKDWGRINYKPSDKPKKFKTIPIEQWEEIQKKLAANNIPENKEKILKERNTPNKAATKAKNPLTEKETKSTTLTPYQEMLKKKRGF